MLCVVNQFKNLAHELVLFKKSASSFFNGWRETPGTIPATSQLDWLISTTATNVLF